MRLWSVVVSHDDERVAVVQIVRRRGRRHARHRSSAALLLRQRFDDRRPARRARPSSGKLGIARHDRLRSRRRRRRAAAGSSSRDRRRRRSTRRPSASCTVRAVTGRRALARATCDAARVAAAAAERREQRLALAARGSSPCGWRAQPGGIVGLGHHDDRRRSYANARCRRTRRRTGESRRSWSA